MTTSDRGGDGARISPSGRGRPCAKTIAPTADAWEFLTHDLARSKAYRWGEDGIAGICDRYQLLCFAPAFWNGRDPILKERLFGLTPHEGNHGEDVKEYYYYLDNLPSHAYMKFLYKYPQGEYPYCRLIEENQARSGQGPEFELLDTGIFDEDRYFDIVIEYAKATPEDIVIRIEAFNRGPDAAPLHILPQLWFRNTWAWGRARAARPTIRRGSESPDGPCLVTDDPASQPWRPSRSSIASAAAPWTPRGRASFFSPTTRRTARGSSIAAGTNSQPLRQGRVSPLHHQRRAVHQPARGRHQGRAPLPVRRDRARRLGGPSSAALRSVEPRGLRFAKSMRSSPCERPRPTSSTARSIRATASDDERRIQRQALAGLLWSKQSYLFDVNVWLDGDDPSLPAAGVAPERAQPALAAPELAAGDDGPRQVGISLVRGLGPGVPLRRLCPGRPRVRQGPALGPAVRAVPAPQRPDPGLRVGVLRHEPAGARLGRLAGLQHGPHPVAARPTAPSWSAAFTSC